MAKKDRKLREQINASLNNIRLAATELPEPARTVRRLTADILEPMLLCYAHEFETKGPREGAAIASFIVGQSTANALMSFAATVIGERNENSENLAKLILQQMTDVVDGMATREPRFMHHEIFKLGEG
jgi:hypothetical protein